MSNYMQFPIRNGLFFEDYFRFYCDKSHMHGFRDEPPKTFREVYKIYYQWAIIRKHKSGKEEVVFELYDESSALGYISSYFKEIVENNTLLEPCYRIESGGQPASEWTIMNWVIDNTAKEKEYAYMINVEDNWDYLS